MKRRLSSVSLSLLAHFWRFCQIYFTINSWLWWYSLNGLFLSFLVLWKTHTAPGIWIIYPNLSRIISFPSIEHVMLKPFKNKQLFDKQKTIFFCFKHATLMPYSTQFQIQKRWIPNSGSKTTRTYTWRPSFWKIHLKRFTEAMVIYTTYLHGLLTTTSFLHGSFVHPTHSHFLPQ